MPYHEPWISVAEATWISLADDRVGRCRYDPDGVVFHQNLGLEKRGYALCLECGRAVSMLGDGTVPEHMDDHARLRRGSKAAGTARCPGQIGGYKIQTGLALGGEEHTDVFELQLAHPESGSWLDQRTAATSIAVALRQALTEELGIDQREVGWATAPGAAEGGLPRTSVLLYDAASGGAGYVAQGTRSLPSLLRRAREILHCVKDCDAACHACLLTFDTFDKADILDRKAALEFLDEALVEALDLPEELQVLGPSSRLETSPSTV
jgi:hypothetical protein